MDDPRQEPIHPVAALLGALSKKWAEERSLTQMTLGELIEALEAMPPDAAIDGLSCELISYRGYYSDLAIRPANGECAVRALLSACPDAMGECFDGYKGGDFYMTANTPMWVSAYGTASGDRLMGFNFASAPILPLTEKEKEQP